MVISSTHDFSSTPGHDEIIQKLDAMSKIDADILKVAYTPTQPSDVFTLMSAVGTFSRHSSAPVIGISMGTMGLVSRYAAESFGSCLTFGTIGENSAPGQPDAAELTDLVTRIHNLSKGV